MDMKDLCFKPTGKIFINESLCPHYKTILGRCIRLKKNDMIAKYKTVNGLVQIQINEHGNFNKLKHEDDLKKLFPAYNFEF